jgi:hypothetical protein
MRLLDQFGASRLDREVTLGKGNLGLRRIAILGDEVTGKTREYHVIDLTAAAGSEFHHFGDVNKMVGNRVPCDFTCGFCFCQDVLEISPFRVSKEMLNVPRQPIIDARSCLLCMPLE